MTLWKRIQDLLRAYAGTDEAAHAPSDTLGSYTGVPQDPQDAPVQDADDL
ncbi:MAG: hypothetical protein LBU67_03350 [Oscillospiraceae bacterium]|nr:hypothetical protein [Oscillospiraceae bacterium]